MTLKERIKEDITKYKALTSAASKRAFLWDYYRVPILSLLVVAVILILVLVNNIGRGQTSMYAVLVNTDSMITECDASVFDRLVTAGGFDTGGKRTDVNDRYILGQEFNEAADVETLQVITALFTISDLDLYASDKQYFDYFAKEGGFADLSLLIDKDLLLRHQEDLYYTEDTSGNKVLSGVIIHSGSPLHKAGYYHSDAYVGVVARAENLEAALSFIRGLLSDLN